MNQKEKLYKMLKKISKFKEENWEKYDKCYQYKTDDYIIEINKKTLDIYEMREANKFYSGCYTPFLLIKLPYKEYIDEFDKILNKLDKYFLDKAIKLIGE